jgi:hypothetical protein
MADPDHDRLIRLEERLAALSTLNDERDSLLVERFRIQGEQLKGDTEALRVHYEIAHRALVDRVDALTSVVAAQTGTSTGTMRVFLVAAVAVSLLGLVVTIVHLIS